MGFTEAIASVFNKYATFSGRARRAEFWWFVLFSLIAQTVANGIDQRMFGGGMFMMASSGRFDMGEHPSIFGAIYSLAVFIPTIAVTCRRLHDIDRSGWWQLIWIIPLIGFLVLLFWTTRQGDQGPNRFGDDPIGGPDSGGFDSSRIPRVTRP